jgi:hypothetical protein
MPSKSLLGAFNAMASPRRSSLFLVAAASLLLSVTVLVNRPRSVVSAGSLQPSEVQEIRRTVSRERWKRIVRGVTRLEFGVPRSHLQEMAKGCITSISSETPQEALFEVREKSETGRRWNYQLERGTNGWKVIGVGYRSGR